MADSDADDANLVQTSDNVSVCIQVSIKKLKKNNKNILSKKMHRIFFKTPNATTKEQRMEQK